MSVLTTRKHCHNKNPFSPSPFGHFARSPPQALRKMSCGNWNDSLWKNIVQKAPKFFFFPSSFLVGWAVVVVVQNKRESFGSRFLGPQLNFSDLFFCAIAEKNQCFPLGFPHGTCPTVRQRKDSFFSLGAFLILSPLSDKEDLIEQQIIQGPPISPPPREGSFFIPPACLLQQQIPIEWKPTERVEWKKELKKTISQRTGNRITTFGRLEFWTMKQLFGPGCSRMYLKHPVCLLQLKVFSKLSSVMDGTGRWFFLSAMKKTDFPTPFCTGTKSDWNRVEEKEKTSESEGENWSNKKLGLIRAERERSSKSWTRFSGRFHQRRKKKRLRLKNWKKRSSRDPATQKRGREKDPDIPITHFPSFFLSPSSTKCSRCCSFWVLVVAPNWLCLLELSLFPYSFSPSSTFFLMHWLSKWSLENATKLTWCQ